MRRIQDHRHNNRAGASPAAPAPTRAAVSKSAAYRLLSAVAGIVLMAGVSGCSASTTAGSPGAAGETSTVVPAPAAEPLAETSVITPTPDAAAATETVKQTVSEALGKLAAGTPKPATAQVTDALTGAGIAPSGLEVSQSRTPTGLEADAIEAAVLQDGDCIIGQVREGAVMVTVLPVLASGKCFVGS